MPRDPLAGGDKTVRVLKVHLTSAEPVPALSFGWSTTARVLIFADGPDAKALWLHVSTLDRVGDHDVPRIGPDRRGHYTTLDHDEDTR